MKKIVCLFSMLFAMAVIAEGQSFKKSDKRISLGFGLGIYRITAENKDLDTHKSDGAANVIFPLQFEYGLSNHFSLGVGILLGNYFTDTDSLKANNADFFFLCSYYFHIRDKSNFFATLKLGASSFKYKNDKDQSEFDGSGGVFHLGVGANMLMSKHFGGVFQIGYTNYNYSKGTLTDQLDNKFDYKINFSGVQFGLGVFAKF